MQPTEIKPYLYSIKECMSFSLLTGIECLKPYTEVKLAMIVINALYGFIHWSTYFSPYLWRLRLKTIDLAHSPYRKKVWGMRSYHFVMLLWQQLQ